MWELHFLGDTAISIEADPNEWAREFELALQANKVVYVHDSKAARTLAVNPRLVAHWTLGAVGLDRPIGRSETH